MIVRCSGGVFLRLATVTACAVGTARAPNAGAQVSPGARPTAPSRYDDLVTLFTAWRAFQQPKVVNGVPDYSPAAMAAQHRELATYRQRLAALDTAGWPTRMPSAATSFGLEAPTSTHRSWT